MAMLAEPRRKQKWTLNPRGKQWSEDSNKFGQKMLEKMGWTSGKGLGANEQGMTEHVRVKFKDDSAGIGFSKDEQDKYWTEHQENFNDLLQKLHASEEAEEIIVPQEIKKSADLSGKSLELKSKQSRARVHYQKFTRGKDVSKYSTKDLANIFGKRELLGPEKPMEIVEEPKDDILTEPIGAEDTTAGVLTIKGGNMSDYFKSKFPNFHLTPRKPLKDDERDSESECDRRVGFGFTSPSISTFFSLETNKLNHIVDGTPEKTPRKRKSEFYVETPSKTGENSLGSEKSKNSSNSVDHESKIEEHSMRNEENLTKKSKRDKKKTKMEDSVEVQDSSDNDLNSSAKYGSVKNLPSSQQNKSKTKKKKKNREPTECIPQAQDDSESMVNAQGNGSEMPMIKKSKKSPEAENIEVTAEKSKKGKKALKKLSEISGFENPALDLISPDPDPLTKSRRSKRNFDNEKSIEKLSENFVFENPCLDLTSPDSGSSKTSKKNFEVERKLGGLAANLEQLTENFTQNFVFENPALDLDSPGNSVIIKIKNKKRDSRISENMENGGNFEVIREPGVSNEALDLSDESCPKKRVTFNDEVEYNTDSCKKKKLKRKLDKFEVESDRLRKKKIKNETMDGAAFVNEALEIDTVSQEVLENEENEKKDKKSENRRKKRRISNLETITEIPDEEKSLESQGNEVTIEDINGKVGETPPKKKKKKNKKDKNEEKMDNVVKIEDKAENSIDLDKNKENKEDAEMLQSSKKKKVKKDRNKKRESEEEKTGEGVENKVVVESETPKNDRSARSKQKLKHLFAKSPVLHFNGSNINEINGYGVNL